MRIKDTVLNRKVNNGIISQDNANLFMQNATLHEGWWRSDKPPIYNEIQGLGDLVSYATDKLKIHKCHKCKKRQEQLNNFMPFKEK